MRKYYLDTDAVRQLSQSLHMLVGHTYTSGFAVLELLSGISAKEYEIRRAAVTRLLASVTDIDWRLPIDIVLDSFLVQQKPEGLSSDDVENVAKHLAASTSYLDFLERNKQLHRDINLLTFFDQRLSAEFGKVFLEKKDEIKKAKAAGSKPRFTPSPSTALEALVRFIVEKLHIVPGVESGRLLRRYDHSVDMFVDAWLEYYNTQANALNEISPNDWADVLHLTYLRRDQNIFVSNDRKIRKLVNRLIPGAAISPDELRQHLGINGE